MTPLNSNNNGCDNGCSSRNHSHNNNNSGGGLFVDPFVDQVRDYVSNVSAPAAAWTTAAAFTLIVIAVRLWSGHRHRAAIARPDPANGPAASAAGVVGPRVLIGVAVVAALGVAGLGGVRSFEAVSDRFGSPLVPLTADGMIIACTALRLAALTRGWRLPGSLVTTYGFIGGTVWLNIAAAHDWTEAVAHALAPISYAVLVEMLAHLLRLHLRLAESAKPRVTALTWLTSPVVTTRVWLHLARTGGHDPVAARALVQQVIRMSSRLQAICPSRQPWLVVFAWPLDPAHAARSAALQTIRDGLLSAADLAALLPADGRRLDPGALLALVDSAALTRTATRTATRTSAVAPAEPVRTAPCTSAADTACTGAPALVRPDANSKTRITDRPNNLTNPTSPTSPVSVHGPNDGGRQARTDAELVAELHRYGGPMSQREVMRMLGVGTPKAKRLVELAGWTGPPAPATNGHGVPHEATSPVVVAHGTHIPDSAGTHDTAADSGSSTP